MHPVPFSLTPSILFQPSKAPFLPSSPPCCCSRALARSPSPVPQTGHALPGRGSRALTSLTSCWEAQGISKGRKGRKKQHLPETTVTGTGSQHSLFINLQITDSKDIISAMRPMKGPKHATPMSAQGELVQPQDSREMWRPS